MKERFRHHYTREEARQLLPQIEAWLKVVDRARAELQQAGVPIEGFHSTGSDVGGSLPRRYIGAFLDLRGALREFTVREIFLKDLEGGLIDFPSYAAGREVFLCWRRGEPDIDHWHDLDAGFAGRQPI